MVGLLVGLLVGVLVGLLVGLLVGVLVRPLVCPLVRPTHDNSVLKISELSARCKRCHLFGFYTKQEAMEKRETQLQMLPQVHLHVVTVVRVDIKDGQTKEVNEIALSQKEIYLSFNFICTIILSAHSLPQHFWDARVSSR